MAVLHINYVRGGKSGLQRAGCFLTGRRGDPMDSATENIPPPHLSSLNYVLCIHSEKQNRWDVIHRLYQRFEKKTCRT